jgi:hypothetical protein
MVVWAVEVEAPTTNSTNSETQLTEHLTVSPLFRTPVVVVVLVLHVTHGDQWSSATTASAREQMAVTVRAV